MIIIIILLYHSTGCFFFVKILAPRGFPEGENDHREDNDRESGEAIMLRSSTDDNSPSSAKKSSDDKHCENHIVLCLYVHTDYSSL